MDPQGEGTHFFSTCPTALHIHNHLSEPIRHNLLLKRIERSSKDEREWTHTPRESESKGLWIFLVMTDLNQLKVTAAIKLAIGLASRIFLEIHGWLQKEGTSLPVDRVPSLLTRVLTFIKTFVFSIIPFVFFKWLSRHHGVLSKKLASLLTKTRSIVGGWRSDHSSRHFLSFVALHSLSCLSLQANDVLFFFLFFVPSVISPHHPLPSRNISFLSIVSSTTHTHHQKSSSLSSISPQSGCA